MSFFFEKQTNKIPPFDTYHHQDFSNLFSSFKRVPICTNETQNFVLILWWYLNAMHLSVSNRSYIYKYFNINCRKYCCEVNISANEMICRLCVRCLTFSPLLLYRFASICVKTIFFPWLIFVCLVCGVH